MAETARETIEDFSGGVNLHGPLRLAPNEFQSIINMHPVATPSGGGYLQGRGGQATYNTTPLASPIKSLYPFYKQSGTRIMLASSGTQMYKGEEPATLTSIDTGYTSGQKFSFTTWTAKDKVYWINNVEVLKSYDGTTVATVGGSPPVGSQVELFQNRLYILLKDGVRFSDLNVDDTWQAAALLNISDSRGGTGAFLKAANRVLIAGKTSGLWRLDGSPLLGSVFIEYSSVGCIAAWSADVVTILANGQVIPVGVLFLGREGVYLTDGYTVTLVSQRIDPLFTNEGGNPSGFFHNAVGKFYPRRRQYLLSFNAAGGTNDTLWVGTSLDAGVSRVAWSNYTGFAADSFCVLEGGTDTGELRIGRSDEGTVNRFDVNANLDIDIGYNCEFTTRHMDFGDSSTNKGIRWIKATFDASKAVHYFISYFEKQSASGQLSEDAANVATWDSSLWDTAVWAGPTLNSARTSDLSGRYGRYASIRFRNPGGFTPGDGRDFKFYHLDLTARIKDRRFHELFTLNQTP